MSGYLVLVSLLKFPLQTIHSSFMQILRITSEVTFSEIKKQDENIKYLHRILHKCYLSPILSLVTFHSNYTL